MSAPILTVTLNAALDIGARTQRLVPRAKLRCEDVRYSPGGGGLNVARVLHRLDCRVHALYAAGGSSGDHIEQLLADEGVSAERVTVAGETRSNLSVVDNSTSEEYRFVLPGPPLSATEWRTIQDRIETLCPAGGHLVASGSLPAGAPEDAYAQLAGIAKTRSCRYVLDTAGKPLLAALRVGVHTVKPSRGELLAATGADDLDAAIRIARQWIAAGRVERVAVSLGDQGARLLTTEGVWAIAATQQKTTTTLGAGDAFLAGLVAADLRGLAAEQSLETAAAVAACAVADRSFHAVSPAAVPALSSKRHW
ncbi:MAG: 1-phosphofructokinase family hexose kinase [Alphaproteobacteria bacterium]